MHNRKSDNTSILVYGHHAVISLLKNPKRICSKLYLLHKNSDQTLIKLAKQHNVEICFVDNKFIDKIAGHNVNHQNIALEARTLEQPELSDIIKYGSESSVIIMLDQVNDPQNIGSILRSAAGFNADAVIIPEHYSPKENATIVKCSAGASELVPLIKETNLAQTMNFLKKNGYWIYGFDAKGENNLPKIKFDSKTVLVFGSEQKGMRKLVSENCDQLVKIDINNQLESLNVASTVSIALYDFYSKNF